MPFRVVTLPLRIGLSVTRTTLVLSAKLAVRVAGEVVRVAQSRAAPPESPTPASTPAAQPAAAADVKIDVTSDFVSPIEAFPDPQMLPDTPLTREEAGAKTLDDTDELVGEYAEAGAEDGAGAQIVFDEPWEAYDSANVEAVSAQIATADAALLAVVELYEQTHRARKTVLDAAARRLGELSGPNPGE